EGLGLDFVVPEGERLVQLNAVRVPDGVDEAAVRARLLEEHGLEIGAGLGALAGRVWRIGLMGYSARPENVRLCVRALGEALRDQGQPVDPSEATRATDAVLEAVETAPL
ncbi:MAG: hypothetical protein R3362_11970, partial [Rhodothermales bacterium]|nr:hypothetical protein [Rhodothermales bacterium]